MLGLAVALAALVLLGFSILGSRSPSVTPTVTPAASQGEAPPPVATSRLPARSAVTPPVDAAVKAPLAANPTDAAAEMSQGLVQDLAMFNSDQLRAELESIALSYPAVTLVAALCAARPCRAEVSSGDGDQLNQYVEMVVNRFQGHVSIEFQARRTPAGSAVVHASFVIGTPRSQPAPRYPP